MERKSEGLKKIWGRDKKGRKEEEKNRKVRARIKGREDVNGRVWKLWSGNETNRVDEEEKEGKRGQEQNKEGRQKNKTKQKRVSGGTEGKKKGNSDEKSRKQKMSG